MSEALTICPICKCRMNIEPVGYEFEGDQSPDTQTVAYFKQNEICISDTKDIKGKYICSNHGKVVNIIKHRLNGGE